MTYITTLSISWATCGSCWQLLSTFASNGGSFCSSQHSKWSACGKFEAPTRLVESKQQTKMTQSMFYKCLISVNIHAYNNLHMHTYLCVHMKTHTHTYVLCMYACMYMGYVCMYTWRWMHVCTNVCVYMHIHVYIYIYIYTLFRHMLGCAWVPLCVSVCSMHAANWFHVLMKTHKISTMLGKYWQGCVWLRRASHRILIIALLNPHQSQCVCLYNI